MPLLGGEASAVRKVLVPERLDWDAGEDVGQDEPEAEERHQHNDGVGGLAWPANGEDVQEKQQDGYFGQNEAEVGDKGAGVGELSEASKRLLVSVHDREGQ